MNLPKKAEYAHATLAAAFNTGDVTTVMSMYDVEGIIVPEPGKPVSGSQCLEEAIKSILTIKGRMEKNRLLPPGRGYRTRAVRVEHYRQRGGHD